MRRPQHTQSRPRPLADDIVWTRILSPAESYQIDYIDAHGVTSTRVIALQRLGHTLLGVNQQVDYLGAIHQGQFKTFRAANIRAVRQLTEGHPTSIFARNPPRYADRLPVFPVPNAIHKVATIAVSNRRYTVDLNRYTCTCPEKRLREPLGYQPGQLGFVCPHMARAIVDHLPASANWPPELLAFLANPRKVHIDNLA